MKPVFAKDDAIEKKYSEQVSLSHRKKFAQFFTPYEIAEVMAEWLLGSDQLKTILDPAFGLGVFSRALLSRKKDLIIKGFEVDEKIYGLAKKEFKNVESLNLLLEDYMFNDWNNKYSGVICNPPYFKFHDYDNKSVIREVESKIGCKLNGFTNLYTLFLLKSIYQLSPGGRLAYIVPSEFMNSDYGKLVKDYLIKTKTLRYIAVIDFKKNIFDDAITTASMIFCANDTKIEKVKFHNVHTKADLKYIVEMFKEYPTFLDKENVYELSKIVTTVKWKGYYQYQNSKKYNNLVPFSTFARVSRGIATGSNDFFTFNSSKAKKYLIDDKFLIPCITKSTLVKGSFFNKDNFDELIRQDKSMYLLNAVGVDDGAVKEYISQGEKLEINKKYLTANRNPWYSLENKSPAPIWVSVFNRNGLRFIRNEANILNLTSFHGVFPQSNLFFSIDIDVLFAYLLTDTARDIFKDNCREYGNGLSKFEPNDLNTGMIVDLSLLSDDENNKIVKLLNDYKKTNAVNKLEDIDLIFKKKYLI